MSKTDELLKSMRLYAAQNYVPIIRPETERILCSIVEEKKPRRILELGAAIGYSAISLCRCMDSDGRIITVERDGERAAMARDNIAKAEMGGRIRLVEDDALTLLQSMDRPVDLIFLDADKSHYIDYYEDCLRLLNSGGVIFADNVLFAGLVEKEGEAARKHRTIVNNLRQFISIVEADERVTSRLIKTEDGILLITKR
ncbi:MAG: O-methyltransferase [Ruminococcaceae bacterium]|nr:O-methyltransferase [Oscillospiraceae bacterium]